MFQKPDIQPVLSLARKAGEILMYYRGKVSAEYKGDNSPVTQADKESSDLIIGFLKSYTPHIPVVSEEQSMDINRAIVRDHATYWVTDPLDGTKSYIDGYDGFGVHIGLIHNGEPVMGIAFFPAQDNGEGRLYYTGNDGRAYLQQGQNTPEILDLKKSLQSKVSGEKLKVALGWRDTPFQPNMMAVKAVGGARLCVTAEGAADIAQFNSSFAYWDVAAGHAILKAAGGDFYNLKTALPLTYTSQTLITPPAIGGLYQTVKPYLGKPALPRPKSPRP